MSHKWYIVHAYSGFEKKVAAAILEKAKTKNIETALSEIIDMMAWGGFSYKTNNIVTTTHHLLSIIQI